MALWSHWVASLLPRPVGGLAEQRSHLSAQVFSCESLGLQAARRRDPPVFQLAGSAVQVCVGTARVAVVCVCVCVYRAWRFRVPAVNVEKPPSYSRQLTAELACSANSHEQLSPADVRGLTPVFPSPRSRTQVLPAPA